MPNSLLVIVNPTAGGGRAARMLPWIGERLASRPDARLLVTREAGQAESAASEAGASGFERAIAVGGDGSIQEVVNGLVEAGAEATVGIVPVGSGNDFARSLGLPLDPAAAWTVAVGRGERAVDLLQATREDGRRRWFASAGGIGFDAQVAAAMARRAAWQRGRAGYLLTTLAELRRFSNRRIELTVDGTTTMEQVLFVAVANGEYYGGGMRIAPGARVDDGMLDLCVVGDISRTTAVRQLANLYRGTHVNHPRVRIGRGRTIRVEADAATYIHLDGEPFGTLPLSVEVHPGRLLVVARARPAGSVRRASGTG